MRCVIFSIAFFFGAIAHAQSSLPDHHEVMVDGCRFLMVTARINASPGAIRKWTGKCVNGYAEGPGYLWGEFPSNGGTVKSVEMIQASRGQIKSIESVISNPANGISHFSGGYVDRISAAQVPAWAKGILGAGASNGSTVSAATLMPPAKTSSGPGEILGVLVGDNLRDVGWKFANVLKQGFSSSPAYSSPNKNVANIGMVYSRKGKGSIGWDRLVVIFDDKNSQVKTLFREEYFDRATAPVQDVFLDSVRTKFALAGIFKDGYFDPRTGGVNWGMTARGATKIESCLSTEEKEGWGLGPLKLDQVLYADQNSPNQAANFQSVNPAWIRLTPAGEPVCNAVYRITTDTRGGASAIAAMNSTGTAGNFVNGYQLTAIDLNIARRDYLVRAGLARQNAQQQQQDAINRSVKPTF